jgi:putative tricarboxylic transport membrane protein
MTTDRVAGGALALFAAFLLWESRRLPLGSLGTPGPAFFPVVLALLLLAAGVVLAALGGAAPRASSMIWSEWRHTVAIFAACAFCALALERLGYRLTIFLVCAFLLGAVERKRPLPAAIFSAAMAGGTFFLFDTFLRVPLPRGPFGY